MLPVTKLHLKFPVVESMGVNWVLLSMVMETLPDGIKEPDFIVPDNEVGLSP